MIAWIYFVVFFVGIIASHYDSTFKSHHQLSLSILKELGFGQRVIETRILIEVEAMIYKLREHQGRCFDMRHLTTTSVANVIMGMLFGRRFDHSDPGFQQLIFDVHEGFTHYSFALYIFPTLRIFPYFKRIIARFVQSTKRSHSFVYNNIDACSQVCKFTIYHQKIQQIIEGVVVF